MINAKLGEKQKNLKMEVFIPNLTPNLPSVCSFIPWHFRGSLFNHLSFSGSPQIWTRFSVIIFLFSCLFFCPWWPAREKLDKSTPAQIHVARAVPFLSWGIECSRSRRSRSSIRRRSSFPWFWRRTRRRNIGTQIRCSLFESANWNKSQFIQLVIKK